MAHASKKELQKASIKKTEVAKAGGDKPSDMHELFDKVKLLTGPYVKRMRIVRDDWSRYELALKYPVKIANRTKNNVPFVSVIEYRNYVALNVSPVFTNPDLTVPPELAELFAGKACFKITKLTPALRTAFRTLLTAGFEEYKNIGWIAANTK